MENMIFQGEKLGVAGQLKDSGVVTTGYTLKCQVFSSGKKVMEIPMLIDTQEQKYYCEIDTKSFIGQISIRFVAHTQSGDRIVSNGFIQKLINA